MIKIIITDIDGVLTDGKVLLTDNNLNNKSLCLKDIDTVQLIQQQNIQFGVITGEENTFTRKVQEVLNPTYFVAGCKEKKKALQEIADKSKCTMEEICYIGDGKYDIEAIVAAGIGICPSDAIEEVVRVSDYQLSKCGGMGCLAEAYSYIYKNNQLESTSVLQGINETLLQHKCLIEKVEKDKSLQEAINKSIIVIAQAFLHNGQVLFCGNGGSAADAQHIATEFVSRFYLERKALNAEALSVNTSTITAIGNDYDYNRIFARQVEAKGRKGDILVGITTSGSSGNIIRALEQGKGLGMTTIAMVGEQKKYMEGIADIIISVPSHDTPRIQEMHIMIGHIICEHVEKLVLIK